MGGVHRPDSAPVTDTKVAHGAPGDRLPFVLSNGRQNMKRQFVGVGIVDRDELDAGIHHGRDKGQVAREPVQLGDDELRLVLAAEGEGLGQLRPIGPFATLDLNELADELPGAPLR